MHVSTNRYVHDVTPCIYNKWCNITCDTLETFGSVTHVGVTSIELTFMCQHNL